MGKPKFTGLSHVCVIVDDLMEAFSYYERILGAIPDQCIPHWNNKGFFECAGYLDEAETAEISIGFLRVPGTAFTIEIMEYHNPQGRREPVLFHANDVSGARHVALKVINIEEAFQHIKAQPDTTLINTSPEYRVFQIGETKSEDFYYFDKKKESDAAAKAVAANILGTIKYFYFIDKYGLQWEFEQGHTDIGDQKEELNMNTCKNNRPCPCTYDCPNHGSCCDCAAHHRDNNEGVPGCFFSKEAEAAYDRSVEALARDMGILK